MLLKKGSKGEDVKKLQTALGLDADGIFGSNTEKAVIAWQKAHGLTADGIVGDKTWSKMFSSETKSTATNSKQIDPSVTYSPLTIHYSKLANRQIKYLAIHFTAGSTSKAGSAMNVKHVFEKRQASADFCVDDANMVQFNPDLKNCYCWAVGDKKNPYSDGGTLYGKATNRNTVSIEICSSLQKGTSASSANHTGWYFTDEALANAVKLSKIIMKKYNIDIDHVVRHYDISGKLCPGIQGWNHEDLKDTNGKKLGKNIEEKWHEFKQKLL